MRTFGYIRFSFLGRSDVRLFHKHSGKLDDIAALLFSPERMHERFYWFEKLCVPSLTHQADKDFKITILASEKMPDVYKQRLEKSVSHLPNVEILTALPDSVQSALRPVCERNVSMDDNNSIHFRLDDDDALPVGFTGFLKSLAKGLEPFSLISLPRGYTLFSHQGEPYLAPHFDPFHARGWARVNAPGDLRTPYNFGHYNAAKRFKSVMDPRPIGYIAAFQKTSDSQWHLRRERTAKMFKIAQEQSEGDKFDSVVAEVENAFPWIGYNGLKSVMANANNL